MQNKVRPSHFKLVVCVCKRVHYKCAAVVEITLVDFVFSWQTLLQATDVKELKGCED